MMRSAVLLVGLWVATAGAVPDLIVEEQKLASTTSIEMVRFEPNACELQPADHCVAGPGARKLLRFAVAAANVGDQDLIVGDPLANPDETLPNGDPKWTYSVCHKHYHFQTFALYELRPRGQSTAVLTGEKRSFCVEDGEQVTPNAPAFDHKFCCTPGPDCPNALQGVHAGWSDVYPAALPCQWIDITDGPTPGTELASGDYDLCVSVNTGGYLDEQPQDNNTTCVPITIDAPQADAPKVKVTNPKAKPAKVGRKLKIAWKKKPRGDVVSQDVFWSKDGGATWNLLATTTQKRVGAYPWRIPADAATDTAKVRVVVWQRFPKDGKTAGSYQRGVAESATFRITP